LFAPKKTAVIEAIQAEYAPKGVLLNLKHSPETGVIPKHELSREIQSRSVAIARIQSEINGIDMEARQAQNNSSVPPYRNMLDPLGDYRKSIEREDLEMKKYQLSQEVAALNQLSTRLYQLEEDTRLVHYSQSSGVASSLSVRHNLIQRENPNSIQNIQESTTSGAGLYTVPLKASLKVEASGTELLRIRAGGPVAYVFKAPQGAKVLDLADPIVATSLEAIKNNILRDPQSKSEIDRACEDYARLNNRLAHEDLVEHFRTTYVNQLAIEKLVTLVPTPDLIVGHPSYGEVESSREVVVRNQEYLNPANVEQRSTVSPFSR